MELNGKVAIITGGAQGLGKVMATRFAEAGADLVLTSRSREHLERTAAELQTLGRNVVFYVGDASVEETAIRTVDLAVRTFSRIDILVNNAGIEGPNAPITGITREDWDQTLAVNLTSAFLFCKHAVPHMQARKQGSVINIASLSGTKGLKNRATYCCSKWGMVGLSRVLAEEVGPDNVRVNTLCPGAVEGERIQRVMQKRAADFGVSYEEMLQKTMLNDTPLRRLVTPDEVAATAVFLASDAASGITGEEILITGGRR